MGGVPLALQAKDRKLLIVPDEAANVHVRSCDILANDSVRTLVVEELRRDGFVSKRRVMKER
jgi:hypothetical protein